MNKSKQIQLLREFIKENVALGNFFSLNRHVTMNALGNTLSGPHPFDSLAGESEGPQTSLEEFQAGEEPVSVTDHLSIPDEED